MRKMGIVRNTYFKPIEIIIRHAYKQRYGVKNVVFKESGDFVAIGDGFAIGNNAYDFDTCLTPSNNLQLRVRGNVFCTLYGGLAIVKKYLKEVKRAKI